MSAPGNRKFWQVHLSTVVLLALYCGGIMCLNYGNTSELRQSDYEDYDGRKHPVIRKRSGWPFVIEKPYIDGMGMMETKYIALEALNLLVTIAGFCVVVAGSERRIRRIEARKTDG